MPKPCPAEISQIGNILEDLAREQGREGSITYGELANRCGHPPVTEFWKSHPFHKIFLALDDEDHAAGRPFRTALVVSDSTDYPFPGAGFFEMLKLKRFGSNSKGFELRKFEIYVEELNKLEDYYCRPADS